MKNKTRRFSKSAFSVILALCMLLSCLTVGVIPTGAANVEGESTGARSGYTITGSIDSWARSKTMTVSPGGYYCYYDLGANTGQTTYDLAVVESSSSWTRVISRNNTNAHPSDSYWGSGALENGDDFWFWFETSGDDNFHVQPKKTQSHVYVVCYYPNTELNQYSYAQVCCYTSLPNDTPSYYVKNNFNQSSGNTETFQETALTASDANISLSTTYSGTVTFAKASQNYKFQIVKQLGSSYKSNNAAIKKYFGLNNNTISQAYSEYDLYTENDYCKFASPDLDSTTASFTVTDSDWSNNKVQLNNSYPTVYTVSYTLGSNVSYSSVSGGTKTANGTIKAVSGSNVALTVSYATNFTYDSSNSVLNGAAVSNSNKTFTFSNISANKSITINAKSSLTQLSAPTIKYNNATTTPVTMDAAKGSKARITWDSDSDAGSYEVYKGSDKVATVTTNYYDIERGYSYGGTYTVKAVPSNTNLYSTSSASNGIKFTFDKVLLSAPTVAQSATDIAKGDTVVFTLTNTNTSYTADTDYNYQHSGENNNTYSDVSNLSWTTDELNTAGARTFRFKATAVETDYFSDSSVVEKTVTVYAPSWYLTGDLVRNNPGTPDAWKVDDTAFAVNEFVSSNVFSYSVTTTSSGNHYFRLYKQVNGNQYGPSDSTDKDMANYDGSTEQKKLTASGTSGNGAMYVTGKRSFKIYVDQTNSNSPMVWVVATSAETKTTTIYVNKDSDATNLYLWSTDSSGNKTADINTWTGEALSTEETINDINYYKIEFESNQPYFRCIPNKNSSSQKSADSEVKAIGGTYYVVWDGTNGSTPTITDTAPVIQLGYKVQNSNSPSHADFTNRSVSVTLAANTTYEFWLKSANSHLNDQSNGTMTRANCTNWSFPVNNTNTKIQTDLAGTYTFTYTVSNGNISVSVTYPPEPKYNVTVNQGDHGTVKVNGSNFTTGGTIQVGSLTTASIEAVAASGYHFTGWTTSGGVAAVSGYTTSSNPITISASAQGTITATYAENSYTLTLASGGNGSITTPSSKTLTVHPITATSLSGVTVTPANGYKFNGWTAGEGVTLTDGSTSSPSTGSVKATQNSTLTATFTKVSYTLTGKTSLNGTVGDYGTVKFYSDQACSTQITSSQIGNTVYAKFASDSYALVNFTLAGTGSATVSTTGNVLKFTMGYANVTVTANVREQPSITYYVDMHNNDMTGKSVEVAIVTNAGGTVVVKDSNNADCKKTLVQQGSSTVYAESIPTPITKTGNTYGEFYVRVKYGSYTTTLNISSANATTIMDSSSREVWIEGLNEAGNTFKITSATNTTTAVESGKKRIYVAKPFDWQNTETSWKNLRLYHWGDYTDIGWSNAPEMTYIGYDSNYHYYYVDVDSGVSNIIFQGWKDNSTYPDVQTGNIENIGSANYFVLSKEGSAYIGTKGENATAPGYTRYVSRVDMNVGQTANITPTHTGAKVTYSSNNENVTVTSEGEVSATASAEATITVNVYGTVGAKATGNEATQGVIRDSMTYSVTVSVRNPGVFSGFKVMSFAHQEYTVTIPTVQSIQPGYFILNNTSVTVSGLYDGSAYTASYAKSAIITGIATTSVTGMGDMPTAFTVKYAASYGNYANISLKDATIKTCSIKNEGTKRFGFKEWNPSQSTISSSKVIDNGVETVTHKGLAFVTGTLTYTAVFEEYHYVDVTFTFNYDEYKPKKVDADGNVIADDADGMIQYPYDASWANNEDSSNDQLYGRSHITKTFVVQDFEVRYRLEEGETFEGNLRNAAAIALGIEPSNNYYDYSIPNNVSATTPSNYKATSTINLIQSVKQYNVYLNGDLTPRSNSSDPNDNRTYYYYQEYAELTVNTASNWYAVDTRNATDTSNAPLLATNTNSYKFRVKGSANSNNTYLRTDTATDPHGNDFLRSEVDFSHYEVTHQGNDSDNMKEYLMQNFYIADFFSPAEVLDPNSNNGQGNLPYDDAQFVGGGVVYYSMNGVTDNNPGTPFANAISSGYVGNDGKVNANAIKEMLKANIEAQYNKDNVAGTVGEDDAMKAAYGTEIEAKKNVEGGFNTGIIYRYLPLNEYKRDGSGNLETDGEGKYTLAYDVNNNTFRYSNTLQSYQYVYASGNENKETNAGKNMRLYSYYVYSYVAYNQETNVPETRYEIVLSDNYSDASTYWEGSNN